MKCFICSCRSLYTVHLGGCDPQRGRQIQPAGERNGDRRGQEISCCVPECAGVRNEDSTGRTSVVAHVSRVGNISLFTDAPLAHFIF